MFEPVLQSESITLRLWHEFGFAIKEFRDNPSAFVRNAFSNERQKDSKRNLRLAAGFTLFFYSIFLVLIMVLGISRVIPPREKPLKVLTMVEPPAPNQALPVSSGHGGNGGDGDPGGGQKAPTPVSNGQLPRTAPTPPLLSPDPRRTPTTPPDLAVAPTVQAPTVNNDQIPNVSVGIPTAQAGLPPSPGTGTGGGLGEGHGPGAGNKNGPGVNSNGKPGNGGTGPGGGGPGGPLGNNPNGPRNGANATNSRARVYYMPEPHYTLDALKNKVVGRVVVFIRANADGTVSNARVLTPLGYGLDEEAIRVAMLVKFYPKIENGRAVDDTMSLTIPFRGK